MLNKLALALFAAGMLTSTAPLIADDHEGKERTAGQVIDDMSIAGRLKAAYAADPVVAAMNVDIEVDKDKVQLNGFVDSDEARDRAEEIATELDGVASVKNNLRIQDHDRTAGQYADDKILVSKVKAALADDPVAHSLKIDVEVDHGVVSLGGHVGTETEREAAVLAASTVEGVKEVINNLDIRS